VSGEWLPFQRRVLRRHASLLAVSLAVLWAVDAAEAYTFRVSIVEDLYCVAVEDRDDWAGEVGGEGNVEKTKQNAESGYAPKEEPFS
jgi:hypothetical protein